VPLRVVVGLRPHMTLLAARFLHRNQRLTSMASHSIWTRSMSRNGGSEIRSISRMT
jgi:hypothetical protein